MRNSCWIHFGAMQVLITAIALAVWLLGSMPGSDLLLFAGMMEIGAIASMIWGVRMRRRVAMRLNKLPLDRS